jgi:predicted transcriptional regulator
MMDDPTMLWNLVLSVAAGAFLWWIRGVSQHINDVKRRLADTREEIAKTYSTKQETEENIKQILKRFDKLEAKMDSFIERILSK